MKDGETVDSMFIARSEDAILVGSTYIYVDGDGTVYYDVQGEEEISSFPLYRGINVGFYSVVTDWYVECSFYPDEDDVPEDNYYSVSFLIDDNTYCFVITYVGVNPWVSGD